MLSPLKISYLFLIASLFASEAGKPDLQKVYNEALTWSKEKLQEIPAANLEEKNIGRCEGEPAFVVPNCSKNRNKQAEQKTQESERTSKNSSSLEPRTLVFVSLSMPKASLVSLARDAAKHNATLVLRGIKNNSFKEMLKAIQDLGEGLEINPELFKQYNIQAVPTFVLVKADTEINRLSGNVSLNFAAQKLKEGAE